MVAVGPRNWGYGFQPVCMSGSSGIVNGMTRLARRFGELLKSLRKLLSVYD